MFLSKKRTCLFVQPRLVFHDNEKGTNFWKIARDRKWILLTLVGTGVFLSTSLFTSTFLSTGQNPIEKETQSQKESSSSSLTHHQDFHSALGVAILQVKSIAHLQKINESSHFSLYFQVIDNDHHPVTYEVYRDLIEPEFDIATEQVRFLAPEGDVPFLLNLQHLGDFHVSQNFSKSDPQLEVVPLQEKSWVKKLVSTDKLEILER